MVAREMNWDDPITPVRDERSAGIMHTFLLRREQGRIGEAEPLVRSAVDEFPWYPMHRAALVQVMIGQGREDEARSMFRSLASQEFAAFYRDNEWLLGISLAAEACAQLRDVEAAKCCTHSWPRLRAGRHSVRRRAALARWIGTSASWPRSMEIGTSPCATSVMPSA
jgi:hypothetical protein